MSSLSAPDNTSMDNLSRHLNKMVEIGIALSSENNIDILFDMIVQEARALSKADSGTLYILDKKRKALCFKILQNKSLDIWMGGAGLSDISLPDVELYHGKEPNHTNVSSFVALQGELLNIPDVYASSCFDFTGPKKYDKVTGYRSQSMLVMPLKNHEKEVIGVLQLLNAQNPKTGQVVPFGEQCVSLVKSLASQAAIALTNKQLIQEIKKLFYSFIESIATAIDEKSPYTGGHIKRVVKITMALAKAVNQADQGHFKEQFLNEEEMEELRISAWMHDVGKITTPEFVMDKATKLESKFDRIHLIETRFHLIAELLENKYLNKQLVLLKNKEQTQETLAEIENAKKEDLVALFDNLNFIKHCHQAGFLDDKNIQRLKKIAAQHYTLSNKKCPYLETWELENLSIRQGTLTDIERHIIENHATMTLKMLSHLPFPQNLSHVPDFAGSHHEKINGTGYPRKLKGQALPLQARIIAIADIFEALSARDRPYRKNMEVPQIFKIMGQMKDVGHIDPDLLGLLITSNISKEIEL